MKKTFNLFRSNKAPAIENKVTNLTPGDILGCGKEHVHGIACIPTHELIAVATYSGVYIHEYAPQGGPVLVFDDHKSIVSGVVHLSDDVLASADASGMLLTWRVGTGVVIDKSQVSGTECWSITKANASEVLVGTSKGEVILVAHTDGKNLTVKKRCKCEHGLEIWDISAYNDVFAAVSEENVEIWNYSAGQRLHSIQREEGENFYSCAVSDELIVIGTTNAKIYVHELRDEYKLLRTIDLSNFCHFRNRIISISDMTFLAPDLIMVTKEDEGLFFISVESGQCIFHFQVVNSNGLYYSTVLSDGRICAGGRDGYSSIFTPPREVQLYISQYTQCMYSSMFAAIPFFSPPLSYIFHDVQRKHIPVLDAVDLIVRSQYHCKSIQQWACAHLIVMTAVKSGDVPRSRKYNGDTIFWWNHLYKKASLIEMGQQDRQRVLQFIIEAEKVGILGGGCAEMFQETNEIRSELNMLSTTIVDLYTHQIAMDEQVRSILDYQKVQQAMSFVNALLACIPFASGVAVHILSGGMAILEHADGEDFAVSALVESLFGVGKDWSSFITEPLVNRFLRAGDVVLEEKIWNEIPEANRRALEAAADGLGLSIDELRRRLQLVAQVEHVGPCTTIVEEVEEEDDRRITDGDQDIVGVDPMAASMRNLSISSNGKLERIEGRASKLAEEKNEERSMTELWKVIEMMRLEMTEGRERLEILEQRNKTQEEKMGKMEARNKDLEEKVVKMERQILNRKE